MYPTTVIPAEAGTQELPGGMPGARAFKLTQITSFLFQIREKLKFFQPNRSFLKKSFVLRFFYYGKIILGLYYGI
jgi:hypothetical protein